MPAPDPFAPFLEPLERLALAYCITGSVAASVYGEPRLTADIDVVLLLKAQDAEALRSAFPETDYYVPPEEKLREEVARTASERFSYCRPLGSQDSPDPQGPSRALRRVCWREIHRDR